MFSSNSINHVVYLLGSLRKQSMVLRHIPCDGVTPSPVRCHRRAPYVIHSLSPSSQRSALRSSSGLAPPRHDAFAGGCPSSSHRFGMGADHLTRRSRSLHPSNCILRCSSRSPRLLDVWNIGILVLGMFGKELRAKT